MKRLLGSALAVLSLCAATAAFAHEGYVTANVTLRAGPDAGYPGVLRLRAGTPIGIEGCVDGWSWCDVVAGEERGWVPGAYLQEEYDGRRVLVRDYGVRIGIPVVSFVFGNYWDNYYRGRSWYGHRERWSHVQPRYYSGAYGHSGGSYDRSGGSYDRSGGSYGHSGGSYDRSGGSYGGGYQARQHDGQARDTQRSTSVYSSGGRHADTQRSTSVYSASGRHADTQRSTSVYSTGGRNGDGQSGAVTMQQGPTARPARSTYAQPQSQRVIAESRSGQGHANGAAANGGPPRSASGEQHSAAGQQRAADVHARNAERHSEHARSESDKDKDHQGQR